MSASLHHVHKQLEGLCEDLDDGARPLTWLEEGKPEEVAATVQLMADVAALLSQSVCNFMSGWDFEEDCRRARAKAAAAAKATEPDFSTDDNEAVLGPYVLGPEDDEIDKQLYTELVHRGFNMPEVDKARGNALGDLIQSLLQGEKDPSKGVSDPRRFVRIA